jgi:hypothetical protein
MARRRARRSSAPPSPAGRPAQGSPAASPGPRPARRQQPVWVPVTVAAVLVVALGVALGFRSGALSLPGSGTQVVSGPAAIATSTALQSAQCQPDAIPGALVCPEQPREHLAPGDTRHPPYNSNPPTSGWHWEAHVPTRPVVTQPQPDEILVHEMEHGAVLLQYRCNDCPDIQQRLADLARKYPQSTIAVYNPRLPAPIVVTAWRRLMPLEQVDEQRIEQFIQAYGLKGPE